jgi:hypothetical protein
MPTGTLPASLRDGHALTRTAADLYWIPLGAGGRCVRFNDRLFEAIQPRASIDSDATSARCSPAAARATCARPAGGDGEGEATTHTLWWPPGKINGRYLTPLPATLDATSGVIHAEAPAASSMRCSEQRELAQRGEFFFACIQFCFTATHPG